MRNYEKYPDEQVFIWRQLNGLALKVIGCGLKAGDNRSWRNEGDWDFNGKSYTGKVYLKITDGNLRNRELLREDKLFFRTELLPKLYRVDRQITSSFSGLIECHIRDNSLSGVDTKPNH